jgi:3-methyladenine DNA glycosylase/8-oxoguanine DNA glycosylase
MQCEAGPEVEVSPAEVLAVPLTDLRAAGLSGQKAAYITDLAAHYADGRLTDAALQGAHTTDHHHGVVTCVLRVQLCCWLGLHSA